MREDTDTERLWVTQHFPYVFSLSENTWKIPLGNRCKALSERSLCLKRRQGFVLSATSSNTPRIKKTISIQLVAIQTHKTLSSQQNRSNQVNDRAQHYYFRVPNQMPPPPQLEQHLPDITFQEELINPLWSLKLFIVHRLRACEISLRLSWSDINNKSAKFYRASLRSWSDLNRSSHKFDALQLCEIL